MFEERVSYYTKEMKIGRACSAEDGDDMTKCKTINKVDPIKQTTVVCAKKSKTTYLAVDRPSDTNSEVCKDYPDFCDRDKSLRSGDICARGQRVC